MSTPSLNPEHEEYPEDPEHHAAPPAYEDHIHELPAEEASSDSTRQLSNDVKGEIPLSQVPSASSTLSGYNTGISAPSERTSSNHALQQVRTNASSRRVPIIEDHHIDSLPPPAYAEHGGDYQGLSVDQNGFQSKARILDDGRIDININQHSRNFANILLPALNRTYTNLPEALESASEPPKFAVPSGLLGEDVPKLNIVIQIIGSRGDVQPFIALGKVLKTKPPFHRVRIATHPTFHKFVEENGLEFFSIGGDPAELMAFMVKNPGLIPGIDSLKQGDVGKRRKAMYEMLLGFWRSCIEAGNGMGMDGVAVPQYGEHGGSEVFVADAIIANPPSYAHIHCAERLAIPLHIMFTMPWTPTQSFSHPLANIKSSNTEANIANLLSYTMVDMLTWQGLGDLVNRFREKTLGLEPLSAMWAPGMIHRLKVPHTYCWSPALIPKPRDWGEHIRICGFFFLDLALNYQPPDDLASFLAAGPPPVYIGFGSIVVDDPNHLTEMIFEAVRTTGVRALVSKGWGGIGGDSLQVPENVFMLGNCPHDWLFKRVSCVVHHGGAGTTAIGIALGKPTVIVPFFGDQPFWGAMVNRAGAGPAPITYKEMTAEKLAEAITTALTPEAQTAAGKIADSIKSETGDITGADSFHVSLDKARMRCLIAPNRAAVWRVKRTEVRLSAVAAAFLKQKGLIEFSDLKLCRHVEWDVGLGPIEPITGAASALLGTIGSVMMGIGDFPKEIFKAAKQTDKTGGKPGTPRRDSKDISEDHLASSTPTPSGATTPSILSSIDTNRDTDGTSITSIDSNTRNKGPGPIELPADPISSPSIDSAISPTSPNSSLHDLRSPHRSAMSSVMSGRRSRSNSPLRRLHKNRTHSDSTDPLKSPREGVGLDMLASAGKVSGRIAESLFKSPLDFTLSLAQGFHNAPRMYGDETVRKPDKITGFHSGLKAAGREFAFGMYDGISGLVTQPISGAKEGGVGGFVKGFGKGIAGVTLKPGAAIWGLPGYTFKGIYEEYRKLLHSDENSYILATRITQGMEELKNYEPYELDNMLRRWQALGVERAQKAKKKGKDKEKNKDKDHANRPHNKRHPSWKHCPGRSEVAVELPEDATAAEEEEIADAPENRFVPVMRSSSDFSIQSTSSVPVSTVPRTELASHTYDAAAGHDELELAIHESVRQTSRGDPEEDRMIEQAIRTSIAQVVQSNHHEEDDDAILKKAIEASLASTKGFDGSDEAHTEAIKQAIAKSLAEQHMSHEVQYSHEVEITRAIEESKKLYEPADDDEQLKLALHISQQEEREKERKAKEEEEIVLNYVKRMSLAEQKYKGQTVVGESSKDAEQEELEKAIQESLKTG